MDNLLFSRKSFFRFSPTSLIIFLLVSRFLLSVPNSFGQTSYEGNGALEEMMLIPGGSCEIGSYSGEKDETPVINREVEAFYIDQYEITNRQFKGFIDTNPQWSKKNIPARFHSDNYLAHWNKNGSYPHELADHPIVNVNWSVAKSYCIWKGKRLPAEMEWEKAASFNLTNPNMEKERKYKWAFGDKFRPDAANTAYFHGLEIGGFWPDWWSDFKKDLLSKITHGITTTSVGSFQAGCNDLYDMTGNVWEWCNDVYEGDAYKKVASLDLSSQQGPKSSGYDFLYEPKSSEGGKELVIQHYRVVRGGSWVDDQEFSRSTNRFKFKSLHADNDIGFRCAISAEEALLVQGTETARH